MKLKFLEIKDKEIIFIFIFATILRFFHLGYQSLWVDEFTTLKFASIDGLFNFFKIQYYKPDSIPPIYYLIMKFFVTHFGDSEFILRLPSAIIGSFTVPMVYYVCKEWGLRKKVCIMSALLTTVSGAMVYYSQEARSNSMMVFFSLVLIFLYLKGERRWNLSFKLKIVYIINAILLCTTHFAGFAFFILVSFLIIAKTIIKREKIGLNIFLGLIPILFVMFWLISFQNEIPYLNDIYKLKVNLLEYFSKMFVFGFNYRMYWNVDSHLMSYSESAIIFYILTIVTIAFSLHGFFKREIIKIMLKKDIELIVFFIFLIITPIILIFLNDNFSSGNKYFKERNFLFMLPFAYIVLSYFVNYIKFRFVKNVVALSWVLFFFFSSFINVNYYFSFFKPNGRELAKDFANMDTGVKKIYYNCGKKLHYQYYFKRANINPELILIRDTEIFESEKTKEFLFIFVGCFPYEGLWKKIIKKYNYRLIVNYKTLAAVMKFTRTKDK